MINVQNRFSPPRNTIEAYDNKNIILTGFMGTGKTTIGTLVAEKLEREFIDTDVLIEQRQGMGIPEIFASLGEDAFREMEADIATELGQRKGLVVATGGRFMLDPDNAAALSENGIVFCLVVSPREILARVTAETDHHRPLLDVPDPAAQISELLQEREAGYRRFLEIHTDNRKPDEIADELLAFLQKHHKNFKD